MLSGVRIDVDFKKGVRWIKVWCWTGNVVRIVLIGAGAKRARGEIGDAGLVGVAGVEVVFAATVVVVEGGEEDLGLKSGRAHGKGGDGSCVGSSSTVAAKIFAVVGGGGGGRQSSFPSGGGGGAVSWKSGGGGGKSSYVSISIEDRDAADGDGVIGGGIGARCAGGRRPLLVCGKTAEG